MANMDNQPRAPSSYEERSGSVWMELCFSHPHGRPPIPLGRMETLASPFETAQCSAKRR